MKKYTYSLIAWVIVASTASTLAQEVGNGAGGENGRKGRELSFAKFDTNGDGQLSEAEFNAMKQDFRQIGPRQREGAFGKKRGCAGLDGTGCQSQVNGEHKGPRMDPEQRLEMVNRFEGELAAMNQKLDRMKHAFANKGGSMAACQGNGPVTERIVHKGPGKGTHDAPRPTMEQRQEMGKKFDVNGDGQLDEAERSALKAYVQQKHQTDA